MDHGSALCVSVGSCVQGVILVDKGEPAHFIVVFHEGTVGMPELHSDKPHANRTHEAASLLGNPHDDHSLGSASGVMYSIITMSSASKMSTATGLLAMTRFQDAVSAGDSGLGAARGTLLHDRGSARIADVPFELAARGIDRPKCATDARSDECQFGRFQHANLGHAVLGVDRDSFRKAAADVDHGPMLIRVAVFAIDDLDEDSCHVFFVLKRRKGKELRFGVVTLITRSEHEAFNFSRTQAAFRFLIRSMSFGSQKKILLLPNR
jgi:hypothetical protein